MKMQTKNTETTQKKEKRSVFVVFEDEHFSQVCTQRALSYIVVNSHIYY